MQCTACGAASAFELNFCVACDVSTVAHPASWTKTARLVAATMVTATLLAACGGGGSDAPTATQGDLSVALSVPSTPIAGGSTAVVSLNVSNTGSNPSTNVVVTTTLGTGLTVSAASCTASGGAVCPTIENGASISIPIVPVNGSLVFDLTVTAATGASGDVQASVTVSSSNDAAASNNSATAVLHAYSSDVSVAGTGPATPVVSGGTAAYTFTVSNIGPDTAHGVNVTTVADSAATLGAVSCVAIGGAACPTALGATMQIADLPKNASVTFTMPATMANGITGSVGLTANVAMSGDSNAANNQASTSATVVAPNSVRLQSDVGDYIGAGKSYTYSNKDSRLSVSALAGHVTVSVSGDEGWGADFLLPGNLAQFQPGTFSNLTRYPFNTAAAGGLNWSGEGRGCNTLVGSITVESATYSAGELKAVDFSFVQHCEGNAPALHGQVHWTAYDTTLPAGPVNPPPPGLWDAATGITPSSGNYIYLEGQPGNYIGGAASYLYTPASGTTLGVSGTGAHLAVSVSGSDWWFGDFQGMSSVTQLQPGYYGDLRRYPFNNPAKGGMSWYGNGAGCNTLTGWFVVDAVTYVSGAVSSIDLRFEQHCEGMSAALHGKIHWAN